MKVDRKNESGTITVKLQMRHVFRGSFKARPSRDQIDEIV